MSLPLFLGPREQQLERRLSVCREKLSLPGKHQQRQGLGIGHLADGGGAGFPVQGDGDVAEVGPQSEDTPCPLGGSLGSESTQGAERA